VQIVPEAVSQIRDVISAEFGKNYTPFAREYKTKAKNAQEAHEAIRPTDPRRKPDQVRKYLAKDQAALYDLIWKRAIASQMAPADLEQTAVDISAKGSDGKTYGLRANGSVLIFDGFLKVYEEGRDDRVRGIERGKDDLSDDDEDNRRLPPLAEGDHLKDKHVSADQHFTQPPPRFSEATLVKRMEELGIGRPSTYASTMAVLVDRDYVRIEKKRLVPEDKGRLVIAFLESFFKRYVEYDFTAELEEKLDLISNNDLAYKDVLRDFWRQFIASVGEIKDLRVGDVLEALNEMLGPHVFPDKGDGSDPRLCPKCGQGRLSLKISGKYGAFIGCGNYPDCNYTRQLTQSDSGEAALDGKVLGYTDDGVAVSLRTGRFGPYVQLGEGNGDEKPKRSSIPKGIDAATLDFEKALQLLSLPRDVGLHPTEGGMITAGLGRFGPFILHDNDGAKTYVNLDSIEEVFTVGLNRAVTLLAEKRAGGGKSRFQRNAPKVLKALGEHPSEGGPVQVLEGRYGPYVTHNKVNATVPRGKDPASLTLDEAVALIAERVANGGGKKTKKAPKAAKPKATKAAKSDKADAAAPAKRKTAKPAAKKSASAKPAAKKLAKAKA
jgi:DNA topoisomerase-1